MTEGLLLTRGVDERAAVVVERAARHEVEGTKAEAMATKARKRTMMNFMAVLGIVRKL